MEKTELLGLSAVALSTAIRSGRTTAVEAAEAVLEQIERQDKEYNCYVTVDGEDAVKRAREIQKRIEAGELTGPLAGVPAALKDNLCTEGLRTTCSSRMLENFVPAFSAQAVLNLEKAGAVVIGKTNMDEFAMGSTTETSYWLRYRRFHPSARFLLRSGGNEANLRNSIPVRLDCLRLFSGSDWAADKECGGLCRRFRGDCIL